MMASAGGGGGKSAISCIGCDCKNSIDESDSSGNSCVTISYLQSTPTDANIGNDSNESSEHADRNTGTDANLAAVAPKTPRLPTDVWAAILQVSLPSSITTTSNDTNNKFFPTTSSRPTTYPTLLQWSSIDRSFLHDVCFKITTLPCITSPNQMNCEVVKRRFPGVKEIAVDCLFSFPSPSPVLSKRDDQDDDDGDTIRTTGRQQNIELVTDTGTRVRVVSNVDLNTDDNDTPVIDALPVPNVDAFAYIVPFLCSFPRLDHVMLGGNRVNPDGRRIFHPLHSIPNRITNNAIVTNNPENDNDEQQNYHQQGEADDGQAEEEKDCALEKHQSILITSLCHAYDTRELPSTTSFVPSLLSKSVCPAKLANHGIVIHGTSKSEQCPYCTRICQSFPVEDVKNALLASCEDSVFDRSFCLSTRRVLEILLIERPGGRAELDGNLFMDAVVKGRHSIVRTLLYIDMLPKSEVTRTWVEKRILAAGKNNGSNNKLSMPKDLFQRLVEEGVPLHKGDFDLTTGW